MSSAHRDSSPRNKLTGPSITPAADLYAFGMVLCHAAGATPLRDGESLESALSLLPARFVGSPAEGWLPPPVRMMVDLHNAPTAAEPGR